MPPLFTIAIPTYNRAALLAEALQSARAQTFDDYEIVVRDNASTDGTAELVRGHGDPRLRYHRNAENVGWHRNFDLLAADARGEFLVYLQDDDLLHPDFLARAAQAVWGRPSVALYAAYLAFVPRQWPQGWALRGQVWGAEFPATWDQSGPRYWPGPLASMQCLFQTSFYIPGLAMRAELCRKYLPWDRELGNAADRLLTGCVAAEGLVAVDPWVGGISRVHEGQMTNQYGDYGPLMVLATRKLLAFYEARSIDWRALLHEWLTDLPLERRRELFHAVESPPYPPELQEAMAPVTYSPLELQQMAAEVPPEPQAPPEPQVPPRRSLPQLVKDCARNLTPPLLWRFARCLTGAP